MTAPIASPIVSNLVENQGIRLIDKNTFDDFINGHQRAVVFFAEDPNRYPETADVARVLPELVRAIDDLQAGVVCDSDQHQLQKEFDFTVWPALAFFKSGQYCGAITRIQNWQDYLDKINEFYSDNFLPPLPVVNL